MKQSVLQWPKGFMMRSVRIVLVSWLLVISLGVTQGVGQDKTATPEPPSSPFDGPPSFRQPRLSPTPSQFEWIDREEASPLLLESLLEPMKDPNSLAVLMSLAEEFSDNFRQEPQGRTEFRTIFNVETVYRYERERRFLSLSNALKSEYQARAARANFGFVNLTLDAGYHLPPLSFALSERFIRSEDLELASTSGIRLGRHSFWHNVISPQVRYTMNRRTAFGLTYKNAVVVNDGEREADSLTHVITPNLAYRFSRTWSGRMRYTFTHNDEQGSDPSRSHGASVESESVVSPNLDFFSKAFGVVIERDDTGSDSQSYGAMIGMRYQLTPSLRLFAAAGPAVFNENGRDVRVFAAWQAGIDGTWAISPNTNLNIYTSQRIENTEIEVDNVGVVLRRTVRLQLGHTLSQVLYGSLFISYTRTEFLDDAGTRESDRGRDDDFWSGGATAIYPLAPNWYVEASYTYRRRDSNRNREEFDENRVMLRLAYHFSVF